MRFPVAAAYCLGVALPVLEVCRRGTDFGRLAAYLDDFLAGGLLLWAAVATSRRRREGPVLLVVAWGALAGGFYYSFFGQLEDAARSDVSGLPNATVVVVKGALYAVVLAALVRSAAVLTRRLPPAGPEANSRGEKP